ncbi:MAG: hypothetical protein J07HX5_00080 [halophilic archaeon J07HX5]|nr:MAG: hypothetical protein J07HX5_00080 [halophilic archaeon J07HX5]
MIFCGGVSMSVVPQPNNSTGFETTSTSWYDIVLCAVPVIFFLSVLIGTHAAVPIRSSVGIGAVLNAGLFIDVLFVHPPVEHKSDEMEY